MQLYSENIDFKVLKITSKIRLNILELKKELRDNIIKAKSYNDKFSQDDFNKRFDKYLKMDYAKEYDNIFNSQKKLNEKDVKKIKKDFKEVEANLKSKELFLRDIDKALIKLKMGLYKEYEINFAIKLTNQNYLVGE